jgi:alkylhydroperoxidase family enzyme
MVNWLMRRAIDAFERKWNYDAGYLREMLDASPRAARLFWRVSSLGQYRSDIPVEAWSAAGITTVQQEDCGPCTQLAVTMAERAGVRPEVLRAVLKEDPERMPADVALVWRFTRASLAHDAAADEYRDAIVKRWGPRALVSLAFAVAAARVYPTVKYVMGHGRACTRVVVGGAPIAFDRELASVPGPRVPPTIAGGPEPIVRAIAGEKRA